MSQEEPSVEQVAIQKAAAVLFERRRRSRLDPVEGFFNTPVPDRLWHYTTVEALEGILTSQRLWATEAHSTTDPTEFIHVRDIATSYLLQLKPVNEEQELSKSLALKVINEEFETGFLSESKAEVFVISFSSKENLKSQWVDYANKSQGVSIAFDLSKVRPPAELGMAVTLAPCIYNLSDKERLIAASLRDFMATAASIHRRTGDLKWAGDTLKDWRLVDRIYGLMTDEAAFKAHIGVLINREIRAELSLTIFDILRLASHCKHEFYSEEKEWRLALPHKRGAPLAEMKIEYRGHDKSIPYVSHTLFADQRLPIVGVMTGPLCKEVDRVEAMLREHGYEFPLIKSSAPLRSIGNL